MHAIILVASQPSALLPVRLLLVCLDGCCASALLGCYQYAGDSREPCTKAVVAHQNMQEGANSSAKGLLSAGSELVLGPWSHGGLVDQSVAQDSSFDQPKHSMAFINRCCDHTPATATDPQQAQQPSQQPSQQPPELLDPAVPSNTDGVTQMTGGQAAFMSTQTPDPQMVEGQTGFVAHPQSCGMSHQSPSKEEEDAASPSVHFFMMGDEAHRGWKACHSWPPPGASSLPLKLFLNKAPGPAAKATKSWFRRNRTSAKVTGDEDVASQVRKSADTFVTYT